MIEDLIYYGLFLFLVCSGVPLAVGSFVALSLAVLQSATQVQEQTIQFLVRVTSLVIVILLGGQWAYTSLITLFRSSFLMIGDI
jgi:type III secretory pathway component EscS